MSHNLQETTPNRLRMVQVPFESRTSIVTTDGAHIWVFSPKIKFQIDQIERYCWAAWQDVVWREPGGNKYKAFLLNILTPNID